MSGGHVLIGSSEVRGRGGGMGGGVVGGANKIGAASPRSVGSGSRALCEDSVLHRVCAAALGQVVTGGH